MAEDGNTLPLIPIAVRPKMMLPNAMMVQPKMTPRIAVVVQQTTKAT